MSSESQMHTSIEKQDFVLKQSQILELFIHWAYVSDHLTVVNMPLQISVLNSLASWTRYNSLAAVEMKHCITVFTLTSCVQMKRVHWFLVFTNLTNESSAAANEAGGDMPGAEPHCGDQAGDQLAGVELLQVSNAV